MFDHFTPTPPLCFPESANLRPCLLENIQKTSSRAGSNGTKAQLVVIFQFQGATRCRAELECRSLVFVAVRAGQPREREPGGCVRVRGTKDNGQTVQGVLRRLQLAVAKLHRAMTCKTCPSDPFCMAFTKLQVRF